jgi:Domain of unknown function (DUF4920)
MLRAVLTAAVSSMVACHRPSAPPPPAATASSRATTLYGQPLAPATPIAIAAVLGNPDRFASAAVTVEGAVRKACTRKGCWMELAQGSREGTPGCRVTFKDYGFFVPTDSAGARARVQGQVEVDTLSASAVRHYEEEGAVFAGKQADGTAREVRIVATGVQLWRAE